MKNLFIFVLFILSIIKLTELNSQWQQRPSGITDEIHGLSFLDLNNGMICGDTGKVWKTVDGGFTCQPQSSGVSVRLESISFADADTGNAMGWGREVQTLVNCSMVTVLIRLMGMRLNMQAEYIFID